MMIGIDVGGTFTDLVASHPVHGVHFVKTPSTPADPSQGVLDALGLLAEKLGQSLGDVLSEISLFIHGTTVATNILVERRGAKIGLLTTKGFRDLLEMREGAREDRYALRVAPPEPIIERPLRLELDERAAFDGSVDTPLDAGEAADAISILRRADVEGVVVCFLHAHKNSEHERAVRDLFEKGDWKPFVSLSHEILNRQGEYDRLSTTAVNAYVGPGLQRYLNRLFGRLKEQGIQTPVFVMQSHGGVLPIDEAGRLAVGAVTSGPAGGAKAGALFARTINAPRLVTYDTGGTTTDICTIIDGKPVERERTDLSGMRIHAPAIEINPIGIGGGSLAYVDSSGILAVGPQSAGATPGPACFGKGGNRPTLTDANLVLGLISTKSFLGGKMSLDVEAARRVVSRDIAEPLGISCEEAAWAIHVLANTRITEGIRLSTVRRGLDPRDFVLMSFGGAGGLHASSVASELRIPKIVIPEMASVLSALGFLAADVRRDLQQTLDRPLSAFSPEDLTATYDTLRQKATNALGGTGINMSDTGADTWTEAFADCRYERQIHTIPVPVRPGDGPAEIEARFVEIYEGLYRHSHPGEFVVVETSRVSAYQELPKLQLPKYPKSGQSDPSGAIGEYRDVFLGKWQRIAAYRFETLEPGMTVPGPALVDAATTSILVGEGHSALVDETRSLVLSENRA